MVVGSWNPCSLAQEVEVHSRYSSSSLGIQKVVLEDWCEPMMSSLKREPGKRFFCGRPGFLEELQPRPAEPRRALFQLIRRGKLHKA